MSAQHSSRARSTSAAVAQAPHRPSTSSSNHSTTPSRTPARPSLQSRTYSAPSGEARTLSSSRDRNNVTGATTVIEEDSTASFGGAKAGRHERGESDDATMSKSRLPQVNLAVVGAHGVGKSTFVQCALDAKHPPSSQRSSKKMSLDGNVYLVRLFEISLGRVSVNEQGQIVWPRCLGDEELPGIDGVLALFDSTDPRSVVQYAKAFNALPKSTTPFLIVECKCDGPVPSNQGDPALFEQSRRILSTAQVYQTSSDVPESQKKCISFILRSIFSKATGLARLSHSITHPFPPSPSHGAHPPRTTSSHSRQQHLRAASETPRPASRDGTFPHRKDINTRDSTTTGSNLASNAQGPRNARSNSQPVPPRTSPGPRLNNRDGASRGSDTVAEETPHGHGNNGKDPYRRLRTSWRHSGGSDAFNSFLDMEDELDDHGRNPGVPPSPDSGKDRSDVPGETFDDLIDRLLSLPISKEDAKYPAKFLCLYRKFATPARLLTTLIGRFEQIAAKGLPQLTRHADQLRLLNVMAQWVSEYPGDLAGPKTRKRLTDFISSLEKQLVFAFAAKEMSSFLEKAVEDEDLGWAFNDERDTPSSVETFLDTSVQSSPATFVARISDEAINNMSSLDLTDDNQGLSTQHSNLSQASSVYRSGSISSQSFLTLLSVESAQQEAQRLELMPRHILSKDIWKIFMEISEEDFAREVTRMDWIMFSSFRPRELVRHVSTSTTEKDKVKGLENVNRMIRSFNHLAFFVASMVLFRDKPKHRAQALEKFMNIAMKLRQLNNYNSLGAVIAGLNGTPVYRLSQTRELVSPLVQKQFMSLVILMGTQKSHFAYRLAWDNSFAEKIPFLPLHLRDLVSAEEGNKTFLGPNSDRINWRKFEIMGDVVLAIQQSQKNPFPMYSRSEDVQRLILETKFVRDEEDLYTRSMQLEPSAAGGEPPRKRFAWRRNNTSNANN